MLKRLTAAFALCALLPLALLAPAVAGAAKVGAPAPDFALQDVNGKTVRLSDYKGRHVVLEWNNPGCPFVQKHYNSGNMQSLQKEATGKGVVWLTINSTESASYDYKKPAELAAWMRQQKAEQTAVLMDESGQTGMAYAARVTPHMYIIDPQGRLIYAGGIDSIASSRAEDIAKATNYIRASLDAVLAGRAVPQATTRAYGCTIKYKNPA